jgi:protein phosphatase
MTDDPLTDLDPDSTGEFPALAPGPGQFRVRFGARSETGRVRPRNEDHYLVARLAKALRVCETNLPDQVRHQDADEQGYLFVVADGMGGVAGGAQASRLAVESVEDFVLNAVHWFLHLGGAESATLQAELRQALERADRAITRRAREEPDLRGMGTTLTFAYCVGLDVFLVHAGDTRGYLHRDGRLEQITHDHTLVQLLVEGGQLRPEEAKTHPRRNVVTNVVGGPNQGVYAEFHKVRLQAGDLLLLCSDGLYGPVARDRIEATLNANPDDPAAAADRLVALALDAGGPDNVTVIVARFDGDADA